MSVQLTRTAVPAIDINLGGIVAGRTTLVTGDENAGKTWLTLGVACAALQRDEPVLFVTDTPYGALCAEAAQFLGRDLTTHVRCGRLTVQTLEHNGADAQADLLRTLREHNIRCLVIDPIEALFADRGHNTARSPSAFAEELSALGVTCFATSRTHARRRSEPAKQLAAACAAQLDLVHAGDARTLWVRHAPWSARDGQAFAIELVPGVGVVPGEAVDAPRSETAPIPKVTPLVAQAAEVALERAPPPRTSPRPKLRLGVAAPSPTQSARSQDAGAAAPGPAAAPTLEAAPQSDAPVAPLLGEPASASRQPAAASMIEAREKGTPRLGAPLAAIVGADRTPRRALLGLFSLIAAAFLGWRGSLLGEVDHTAYSVTFFVAEVVSMLIALWCYYLMSTPRLAAEPLPPAPGTTVDVLILTYNEDLDLVRHTILAARDMDEPHKVWVCDDGRRPPLAEMCREMGVGYITRDDNAHYKAGNINNALACTQGELVLVLDADHVPRTALLTRLMGHFRDPKVAHVQVPQVYYNVDSFQHSLAARRAATWHESSVFHHGIMHGLAQMNATCFLGTGALIRRSALAEIGGVATGNITEDVLTGMRLHALGYKSVFVDEPLASLLAPDTALAYAQQRLRWAQGNIEILRTESPLVKRGLTFRQRIAYFNTFGFYLLSYAYLLVYLVPGIYLFTGVAPMTINDPHNVTFVALFTVVAILNYLALAHPHARLFHCECFKLLNLPINLRASIALLNPGGRAFKVTPKGFHIGLPLWVIVPIAIICLFNLTGLGYGFALLLSGDGQGDALLLASAWAAFYGVAGALTLAYTFSRRAAREPYAMPVSIAARLRTDDGKISAEARLRRLCHELAYVEVTRDDIAVGQRIELQLDLPAVRLTGQVSAHGAHNGATRVLRVDLGEMPRPQWDVLSQYLFETASPRFLEGLEGGCSQQLPAEASTAPAHSIDFLALRSEIV